MSLNPPSPIDVTDLKFIRQNRIKAFQSDVLPNISCNLVASASSHGLIFIGTPTAELRVLQLSELTKEKLDGEAVPLRTVNLPSDPFQIAISCDHSLLAVDVVSNGVSFLYIYSVPSFLSANVVKIQEIRLSIDGNIRSGQICWNPVISNMFSVVCQNGSLSVYTIKENQSLEFHSLDKSENAMCACWSPKGKQIVVGFGNGKLVQFKPDLKPARTIPCPAGILDADFDVINIQWLSTYQFCAAFINLADDSCPKIFIINAPKNGNPSYINYDEIVYNGGTRFGQIFLEHILPWNILFIASSSSNEIGILATTETGETPTWCQWTTTDDARAELPLNDKKDDTYPLGFALETGCTHEEIIGETPVNVGAMIHLVSSDGDLVSFNIINVTPNNASICSPPRPPSDTSGLGQFKTIDFRMPTTIEKSIQPPPTEMTFAVPNGATSTPAGPTKAKSFFSPNPAESKSPMNLFGGAQAMPKVPPTFGQAITFGQPKSAASQPLFGNNMPISLPFAATTTITQTASSPVPQQSSLLKAALNTPPIQQTKVDQNKPLITVPPTYNPPPVQKSESVTEIPTTVTRSINRVEQSDDNNVVIKSMIMEEIQKFEKELKDLINRSKSLNINIGSKEESIEIIKNLKELQDLSDQATESTDSQASDVQTLRLGLNEAFAMLAEGNSKTSIYNNPSPNQYQETHAMSQSSRRQLANLQNILAQNEAQLQIVNRQIDAQWAAHQEAQKKNNKNRMHIPSLEVLYQTLSKEQEILVRQKAKIGNMKSKLGIKENVKSATPTSRNISLLKENIVKDSTIESLTDSMISMSLIDQVKLDACRLTSDKKALIREAAKCVTITKIRAKRPDRIGLNSEIVREKREARKRIVKKEKETVKPVQVQVAPKHNRQHQPVANPIVNRAPEMKPLSFDSKPTTVTPLPSVQPQKSFDSMKPPSYATPKMEKESIKPVEPIKPVSAFGQIVNVKSDSKILATPKEVPKPVIKEVENTVSENRSLITPKEPVKIIPTKEETVKSSFSFAVPATTSILFGSVNPQKTLNIGAPTSMTVTSSPSFGKLQPIAAKAAFGLNIPATVTITPTTAVNLTKPEQKLEPQKADITIKPVEENKENNNSGSLASLINIPKKIDPKPTQTGGTLFSFSSSTTITPSSSSGNIFDSPTTKTTENKSIFGGSVVPTSTTVTMVPKTESSKTASSFSFNAAAAELPNTGSTKFGVFGASQSTTAETVTVTTTPSISSIFGVTETVASSTTVKPIPVTATTETTTAIPATSTSLSSSFSFVDEAASLGLPSTATTTTTGPATTFSFNSFSISNLSKSDAVSSTTGSQPIDNEPSSTADTASNLFGSFNICSPTTTTENQASTGNIFGTASSFTTPKTSIFGGSTSTTMASPFGAPMMDSAIPADTAPATGSIFSSLPKPEASVFGSTPTTFGQSTGSIFGQPTGQTTGQTSIFGGGSSFSSPPATTASIFGGSSSGIFGGTTTQTATTGGGGSIFGGSATFGTTATGGSGGNIFGGSTGTFGSSFGQAASPAQGSIFGGSASSGGSAFGQPASFGSPGGNFSSAGTIQETGFGTPPSSAFNKPVFGGSPTFGGAPTFGTATFGSAPGFGSTSAFGSPKPAFSGFTPAPQSPTQTNILFEQLGSSQSGLGFGTLANQQAQKPPEFGGSSFSSWR